METGVKRESAGISSTAQAAKVLRETDTDRPKAAARIPWAEVGFDPAQRSPLELAYLGDTVFDLLVQVVKLAAVLHDVTYGVHQHVVGDLGKPVHGVLVGHIGLGGVDQVFVGDFEAEVLHEFAADKLPLEVFRKAGEILLDVFPGDLAVIGDNEPALEEFFGKRDARLGDVKVADILREAPFCLLAVVLAEALGDFLLNFLVGLGGNFFSAFLPFLSLAAALVEFLHVFGHFRLFLGRGGDGILVHGVGGLDLHLDFGRKGGVEHEGEGVAVFPFQFGLVLAAEGLAQKVKFVGTDVVVEGSPDDFVDGVGECLAAIDALDEGSRDHTLAEALEFGGLAAL